MITRLLYFFFMVGLNALANASDSVNCSTLGFTSDLMCSSCTSLLDFKLEKLKEDCDKCCNKDANEQAEKFHSAVLEVCGWKIGRYPQVQAFVKGEESTKFAKYLKVKYVRGQEPIIKLLSQEGEVKETLGISGWDTNTVSEFLDEKLKK